MIELQNEQLANCLSFDEETFDYPCDGKGPLLSKANLSLLATSLPQRPVCLKLPPPPPYQPTATLGISISQLQRHPQPRVRSRQYFVC